MNAAPLSGTSVLVTRAVEQAESLCALIEREGGEAIRFPALRIVPIQTPVTDARIYDIVLFMSPNAVRHGLHLIEHGSPPIGAIGPTTARLLAEAGHGVSIRPDAGFDSEALLTASALQSIAGRRVLVVRGQGGRELLGMQLTLRGAAVSHAEVYARRRPRIDPGPLLARWRRDGIDLVTVGSVQTLIHLATMLGAEGQPFFADAQLVTASTRVVEKAVELGLERPPLVAAGPDDQPFLRAMLDWRRATASEGGS